MKSHEAFYIAAFGIAAVVLWYVWNKTNPAIPTALSPSQLGAGGGFPVPYDQPMASVYNANPTAYDPPTPADLTLNVGNGQVSGLSENYMPLFGFVGIAQGVEL